MNEIDIKKIVEEASAKIWHEFNGKDIIGEHGVVINGNSTDKDDLVIYTSRKGYEDLRKEIWEKLKEKKKD